MTIIVFLIDTSASMRQKVNLNGVQKTYLDIAKSTVDDFITARRRYPECVTDRYLLITFDEPPTNVKSGWTETMETFVNELKNLQCNGLTTLDKAVSNVYGLLNLYRLKCGIDTYGYGRCPFQLEPTVIIVITDGGAEKHFMSAPMSLKPVINHALPGDYLIKEHYRWDERLYAIALRMAAPQLGDFAAKTQRDNFKIELLCTATGGRSYKVLSSKMLTLSIESIVRKVQTSGVIIEFESRAKSLSFRRVKTMIYVPKNVGNWPLPESYCLSSIALKLPSRRAHPKLWVKPPAVDVTLMLAKFENFPTDMYELDRCILKHEILKRNNANECWHVNVLFGTEEVNEATVGYLRATPAAQQVHLYVLPYNCMVVLPLIRQLVDDQHIMLCPIFINKFTNYLLTTPHYYRPYLRKALLKLRVPAHCVKQLLPESADAILPARILKQIAVMRSCAKQRFHALCAEIHFRLKQRKPLATKSWESLRLPLNIINPVDLARTPYMRNNFADLNAEICVNKGTEVVIQVPQLVRQPSALSYSNPFKIPRRDLIEDGRCMREALLRPRSGDNNNYRHQGHCVPIAEMSNFYATMKTNEKRAMREIQTNDNRQNIFGNPYKKSKSRIAIDETEYQQYMNDRQPSATASPHTSDVVYSATEVNFVNENLMYAKSIDSVSVAKKYYMKNRSNLTFDTRHNRQHVFKMSIGINPASQQNETKSVSGTWSDRLMMQRKAALNHNKNLRMQIFCCIRRPGRDYTELFENLNRIKGNYFIKQKFIDMCINETQRFRRKHMIHSITEWWTHKQIIEQKRREREANNGKVTHKHS